VIYCLCDDFLKSQHHQEDVQTRLSDAEVLTTALVAMLYFGGNFEKARLLLKSQRYMPGMLSRSRYNRRLHRAKHLLPQLFFILAETWKALNEENIYLVDSFPVPVCDNIRIIRSRRYQGELYRGYIASKRRYFYGIRIHLLVTRAGQPLEFFLTPGSASDIAELPGFRLDLPEGAWLFADKASTNYQLEDSMLEAGIRFLPYRKKNSKRPLPPWWVYLQHHYRKMIETTGSLFERLLPRSIHAVTQQGFELKIVLFILALSFSYLL
jgi:hypothetical protein